MPLSWNEIRSRALTFSQEWSSENREHAEAKTFWDQFFTVFGLSRRLVASFEEPVRGLSGTYGFIDLFWKGTLLAEHKSRGKDLGQAHAQAMDYIQDLGRAGRQDEIPRYVIVSDFAKIALHDLEENSTFEFPLTELHQHVNRFGFIPGYKQHKLVPEDPINIRAVQIMGDLHDVLEAGGYSGHELERLLVRILFCLFAEDTGIFERDSFKMYLENHTQADGSDLGPQLAQFFQVLNTPKDRRQAKLREELAELPYVNGELYAESLSFAAFNTDMRNRLLAATRFDWSRISPAVFGALFQAVMEPRERRQIGAHYTSDRDIMKVIGPLFLDDLKAELVRAGNDRKKLLPLHEKLGKIRLLDPACGCGNFLVISYRELRHLELELLRRLTRQKHTGRQQIVDVNALIKLDVDQLYGIEIEEWPVRIAEVAMWLMDHQMNQRFSEEFGQYFVRLPLKKSPHIRHGNALTLDWNEVLMASECSHILGNPPFVGAKYQSSEQRGESAEISRGVKNGGVLDYVTNWYFKAAQYIQASAITVAFVSTNSISQGEQVGVLWQELYGRYGVSIYFAHRTFAWESEARGKAHVHVVIIGFGVSNHRQRRLFDYDTLRGEPTESLVASINPYLVDGPIVTITNRGTPLCDVPEIGIGNKPIDDGNYLFTDVEKDEFVRAEPESRKYFRRWYGSEEFIHNSPRWCLWIGDCAPEELRRMPQVMQRVKAVREFRLNSKSAPTQKLAERPTRFHVENMPSKRYLLIPRVSSELRKVIPMGFLPAKSLASDAALIVPDAKIFHFGVLTSSMHMAWMRFVAGRLESRYRYSAKLVYNNFPWPQNVSEAKRKAIEEAAQDVLDARDAHPTATLADLYDTLTMPTDLSKAHAKLDRAVDRCYRSQPFASERHRVEFLFNHYQELTSPLLAPEKTSKKRRRRDE
ncbi:MAG: DNA methyltransferase [Planctomycetota bacterium]|nr:DNA methyltransferase [Planctomycetota bacterium]